MPAVAASDHCLPPAADGRGMDSKDGVVSLRGWLLHRMDTGLEYCMRFYSRHDCLSFRGGLIGKAPADLPAEAAQLALEPSNQFAGYGTTQNTTDKHHNNSHRETQSLLKYTGASRHTHTIWPVHHVPEAEWVD
jgi:hypothetical protein